MLFRQCNKDYQIPNSRAIIPVGTPVQIPILGIHMDPEYYPNPERFDPERFTEEEKSKRHHYCYLPFGEGPRSCIGNQRENYAFQRFVENTKTKIITMITAMRFGLMQTRVGLATLLSNYRFEISKETQVPMVFDRNSFILAPEKKMNLKITVANKN